MSENTQNQVPTEETVTSVLTELIEPLTTFADGYVSPEYDGAVMSKPSKDYCDAMLTVHEIIIGDPQHFVTDEAKRELRSVDRNERQPRKIAQALVFGDRWERVLAGKPGADDVLQALQSSVRAVKTLETTVQAESPLPNWDELYLPFFAMRLRGHVKKFKEMLGRRYAGGCIEKFLELRKAIGATNKIATELYKGNVHDDLRAWMRNRATVAANENQQ
jgi:hypothetical protein